MEYSIFMKPCLYVKTANDDKIQFSYEDFLNKEIGDFVWSDSDLVITKIYDGLFLADAGKNTRLLLFSNHTADIKYSNNW